LNSTIAIFDLVKDDLKRVERMMRAEPDLRTGPRSPASAEIVRDVAPHPALGEVLDHLIAGGGKRVRPSLALLVSYLYPVEPRRAISLAAAIELLHTATLVHDDLIDGALVRRGNPTVNATWTPGATVLTGDFLFARAADLAAQTDNVQVMHLFARTLMIICSGEIHQMLDRRIGLDRQKYYDRIYAKTAALFAVAAEAAAVLGDAPAPEITALREYGEQLGMAFQVVDDVLDFVSDESKLGKPVGSDLRAGLVTAPTLWFLEQNPAAIVINGILNDGRQDQASIRAAVELIRASGAIEASLDEARRFIRRSQVALELVPPGEYRDALWELADFVVDRTW
jgi:geranylgeranyl pyrophosphate synthase